MQHQDTPTVSFKSPPLSPKTTTTTVTPLRESSSDNIMTDDDRPIKPAASAANGGSGTAWESIRQLDDAENWSERTCIISKQDHMLYKDCAQEIVQNIIDKLPNRTDSGDYGDSSDGMVYSPPCLRPPSPYADGHLPVPSPPVNSVGDNDPGDDRVNPIPGGFDGEYEYMEELNKEEEFNTTTSQLDMDYLERVSSSTNPANRKGLAKESLFVKFDPLVGKNSPIHPAHRKARSNLPKTNGDNLLLLDTPPHNQPPPFSTPLVDSSSSNLVDIPSNVPATPPQTSASDSQLNTPPTSRSVRGSSPHSRSVFDTSSVSGNALVQAHSSTTQQDDELVKVLIYSEADLRKIVQQVRNECEIQNEEVIAMLKIDHSDELAKHQKKIDRLVKEVQNLKAHGAAVQMDKVIGSEQIQDYEELCSQYRETEKELLEAYEQLKMEAKRAEEERDQSLKDFASLERSFNEFHQRYNKSKELVTSLRKTVSELQEHNQKNENIIKKVKQQNSQLIEETTLKLQEANEMFEQIKKESASEVAVMKANAKKMSVQLASLERQLQQKEQEKAELTQICEDLMKELGNKS